MSLAWNCDTEAEVDAVLAAAVNAGGKLLKPAQKAFWGGYHGYFADPDGHLWEVAHNPHFPLSAGRASRPCRISDCTWRWTRAMSRRP